MSEPEKQPEKVEIKPTKDAAPADKTPATEKPETIIPAAANSNEKTAEPLPSITPDVGPKKEPLVSIPVPPAASTTPDAEAPVANDNATVKQEPVPAPVATTAPSQEAAKAVIPNPAEEAPTPAQDPAPAAPAKKGFLKKAFNFAVKAGFGAAVSFTLKTAAVVGAGIAGAPAWATILISGVAVGIGATLVHDYYDRKALKKEGKELAPYFSKAHGKQFISKKGLKTFGISTVAAVAGSMLFMGFHEGIIQGWWNHLTGHVPAVVPPVAPAVVVAPVAPVEHVVAPPPPVEAVTPPPAVVVAPPVVHCVSPVEQFADLVKGHHVSAQVTDAIHRAASSNAHVAAQGTKDLAFYAQNGFGGVPKDPHVAVELFKQAADAGNVQAKVDLLYLQHYGLDGVTPDKTASLGAMKDIAHNARASEFVKAWGGAGKSIPSVKFDTGTILKGMKVGCAA